MFRLCLVICFLQLNAAITVKYKPEDFIVIGDFNKMGEVMAIVAAKDKLLLPSIRLVKSREPQYVNISGKNYEIEKFLDYERGGRKEGIAIVQLKSNIDLTPVKISKSKTDAFVNGATIKAAYFSMSVKSELHATTKQGVFELQSRYSWFDGSFRKGFIQLDSKVIYHIFVRSAALLNDKDELVGFSLYHEIKEDGMKFVENFFSVKDDAEFLSKNI